MCFNQCSGQLMCLAQEHNSVASEDRSLDHTVRSPMLYQNAAAFLLKEIKLSLSYVVLILCTDD